MYMYVCLSNIQQEQYMQKKKQFSVFLILCFTL